MKNKPPFYLLPFTFILRARSERGQFIPISAMVMFTAVVMMVALLNVYTVSRAKLKAQNLADAAALNLAARQAQAVNIVVDRNEWMNHMLDDPRSQRTTPENPNCGPDNPNMIPGISCVEAVGGGGHTFHSRDGAANYARLVQTINKAQQEFIDVYNTFLGARGQADATSSALRGPANFGEALTTDIPDLKKEGVHLIAWNSDRDEQSADRKQQELKEAISRNTSREPVGNRIEPVMTKLDFKVHHDIKTRYYQTLVPRIRGFRRIVNGAVKDSSFKTLLNSDKEVGWMVPDTNPVDGMPEINVRRSGGNAPGRNRSPGVGVYVVKEVRLPVIGSYAVSARSQAYLVEGAGRSGAEGGGPPVFKPTYWVKLADE